MREIFEKGIKRGKTFLFSALSNFMSISSLIWLLLKYIVMCKCEGVRGQDVEISKTKQTDEQN